VDESGLAPRPTSGLATDPLYARYVDRIDDDALVAIPPIVPGDGTRLNYVRRLKRSWALTAALSPPGNLNSRSLCRS